MEEIDIIENIKSLLEQYKIIPFEDMKPQLQEHLICIEKYFQYCLEIYYKIIDESESIDLSTRGVSKGSGVSKSTIYNHEETIKKYVEQRIKDIECNIEIIPQGKYSRLVDENKKMKSMIDKMVVDEIGHINLKIELERISNERERLLAQVKAIAKEKTDLIKTNNELRTKVIKSKNNVLRFKE